jgi:hypothetical protein
LVQSSTCGHRHPHALAGGGSKPKRSWPRAAPAAAIYQRLAATRGDSWRPRPAARAKTARGWPKLRDLAQQFD